MRSVPRKLRSGGYHAAWLLPSALVVAIGLMQPAFVTRLRDQVFDLYQRLAPRSYDPAMPVRIIDIDDASIARIGQWPWSRTRVATLVGRLAAARVAAIAFDIVFSEPDRTSADAFVAGLDEGRRAAVHRALEGLPGNDAVFAGALAKAPAVLGLVLTQGATLPPFDAPYGIANAGDDPKPFLAGFTGAVVPLPQLLAHAAGVGALNWLPDGDQIVRRVPLMLRSSDRLVPSLALEALRVAQGASTFVLRASNASGDGGRRRSGLASLKVGAYTLASDPAGDIRLRYTLHRPERFIPAWKVLAGAADPALLDGAIVIVGSSSAGLTDIRATPVDAAMPGVEVQAQAVESLLTQTRLRRPDLPVSELAIGAALAVVLALALPLVPASAGAAALVLCLAGVVGLSAWAFLARHLLLDPVVPATTLVSAYVGGLFVLLRSEQKDRRFVQNAFGRFVAPAVVDKLAQDPSQLALGGELRTITIMFTDVRNFSAIAERMDAQALTRFMNSYLSPMSDIVLAHAGTIDKYIGDAIMAFWNAPLADERHGENACRAALAMIAALPALQAELGADTSGLPPLRCGIGLASGPCVVGNLGSTRRFDYSALGDDVNLASRLESLTKAYGVDILATRTTREAAPHLAWIDVDTVAVAGHAGATQVATLLGDETMAASEDFAALRDGHDAMLSAYRERQFAETRERLRDLRRIAPGSLAKVHAIYDARCRDFLTDPPPANWDAVTRMEHK